ncbi:MAG: amidophosphoribosyltransferase [Alphaproteobacteria bacterium HGW-Alphaproteobacteria-16]|nr:MAG: amidophosphoribosyltransferase [Alphaproteobacteria bacterium HGW-Alphaproteobacteria-16]
MGLREPILNLVGLVLPPRCPGCGEVVEADHRFCAECWTGMTMIAPPWCATCNRPFDHDRGEAAQCGTCLASPPVHDGVRAAVAYGPVARTLALRLKYGGRTGHGVTAARMMVRLMPPDADLLIPVPLHRWRIWGRGYNQALLIAQGLSRISGVPVERDLLRRITATPVLRGLGGRGRAKAMKGAFALHAPRRQSLTGRHIVLVDDVYTSGATTDACVRVLKRGGAARVTILCWARVIDDSDAD